MRRQQADAKVSCIVHGDAGQVPLVAEPVQGFDAQAHFGSAGFDDPQVGLPGKQRVGELLRRQPADASVSCIVHGDAGQVLLVAEPVQGFDAQARFGSAGFDDPQVGLPGKQRVGELLRRQQADAKVGRLQRQL